MSFFSWFLPSAKSNEMKPLFGQPYLNATGFDNKHEELYCKDTLNVKINNIEQSINFAVGVIESSSDSEGISNALRITKIQLLKLIASNNSRITDILKFLYKNCKKRCLLCNICVVTQEATLYHKSSRLRNITKLFLGHHIFLCIPVEERITKNDEVVEHIKSLMSKTTDGQFPEYFMPEAAILIDYDEVLHKPSYEMLYELHDRHYIGASVSLYAELNEQFMATNYSYVDDRLAASTILKLKKLIYLFEEKFLFDSNYKCGKKPLTGTERNPVAEEIAANIRKIINLDVSTFPPPALKILYNLCKVYELEYRYAVYENFYFPNIHQYLERALKDVYKVIKDLPFEKHENAWFIKVDDQNATEIYSIYLAKQTCILMTADTKHLVADFLNESIIWLFSKEEKWKNLTEPLLINGGKTEILLGMISTRCSNKETFKSGKFYLDFCNCNIDKDPKAWICTRCKTLVRCASDNYAFCECGVFREASLLKKCFKCSQKEIENRQNSIEELIKDACAPYQRFEPDKKSSPPTPFTSAPSTPATPTKTLKTFLEESTQLTAAPTTPTPPPRAKKSFNILFIGQSGAGKSMLVNSIYNYLTYNFEEVSKAETVDCILPCQFQLQTPDFKKKVFKAGPNDDNEYFNDNGESVTQHPKVYNFKTAKYDCQVIDTPGLGDTRGAKQDEHNLDLIRTKIIETQKLHAICFVMPSNISKLTANFEVNMRDLLSLFPKTALKNVYFFFTYANSTFFSIGDTRNSLEQFIETFKATNNAEIPFGPENVCCVDSEAFMYFIATKQGHEYQNRDLESFRTSWDKSKAAIETFLTKIEDIQPIKSEDILMTYELEQIGLYLQKEKDIKLAELIAVILTKISQISMTSKFNTAKKSSIQNIGEFKKQELFQALNLCQSHVEDVNLKLFINKLVEAYGKPSEAKVEETVAPKKNNEHKENKSNIKRASNGSIKSEKNKPPKQESFFEKPPLPLPRGKSPNALSFKEIAEKIGKEWESGKISKNAIENVMAIQIAGNRELKDIDQQKVKLSLERLLMDVNPQLCEEINKFLADFLSSS